MIFLLILTFKGSNSQTDLRSNHDPLSIHQGCDRPSMEKEENISTPELYTRGTMGPSY